MKPNERIPLHAHTDNNSGGRLDSAVQQVVSGVGGTGSGSVPNLADLGDVNVVTTPPADNDALTWDAA